MLRTITEFRGEGGFNPAQRGFAPIYRENAVNHCPGCGHTHWYVGRISAECCFCATALPLSEASIRMNNRHVSENRSVYPRSKTA